MSPMNVSLCEWKERFLAGKTLEGFDAGRQLAERLTKAGRIEILELMRGLKLRATSFVGRFNLGDITVTIRPRLSPQPLLNLLRYGYGLRQLSLYEAAAYGTKRFTFQDLLVHQLTADVRELLARGIHREYERRHLELATPRARIDFNHFAGAVGRAKAVLPCTDHPRIEDTLLNQVLLGGLQAAEQVTHDVDLRSRVRRLAKVLAATVSPKRIDGVVMAEAWRAMDRRTNAYKSALVVIGILLTGEGISMGQGTESVRLPGFLFDMNRFFQTLLSRFLRDNLDGCEVEDERRLEGLFRYDPVRNPQRRRAPVQKPDFVIWRGRKIVAVLDAKYRDLWEETLPRDMLYQVALYALGRPGPTRSAVILYPTTETTAREQAVAIQGPAGGLQQAEVVLRPVNLLELDELVRTPGAQARKQRSQLAAQFVFGST